MSVCPKCGAPIQETQNHCYTCGYKVNGGSSWSGSASGSSAPSSFTKVRTDSDTSNLMMRLDKMKTLIILSLVVCFVPYVQCLSTVLYIVILIKSLSLTSDVNAFFLSHHSSAFADLTFNVRKRVKSLISYLIWVLVTIFLMVLMGMTENRTLTSILGSVILLSYLYIFFVGNYHQIFCFFRLFYIRRIIQEYYEGNPIPREIASQTRSIVVLYTLCIVLCILILIGALAAVK
ncbi:MAG: hypothetical protein ACI4VX_04320 [Succinivibrionaceae bacterium]